MKNPSHHFACSLVSQRNGRALQNERDSQSHVLKEVSVVNRRVPRMKNSSLHIECSLVALTSARQLGMKGHLLLYYFFLSSFFILITLIHTTSLQRSNTRTACQNVSSPPALPAYLLGREGSLRVGGILRWGARESRVHAVVRVPQPQHHVFCKENQLIFDL